MSVWHWIANSSTVYPKTTRTQFLAGNRQSSKQSVLPCCYLLEPMWFVCRQLTGGIEEIPSSPTKYELRSYAREEFERHRNITDLVR